MFRNTATGSTKSADRKRFVDNQAELVPILQVHKLGKVAEVARVGIQAFNDDEAPRKGFAFAFPILDNFFEDRLQVIHIVMAEILDRATRNLNALLNRKVAAFIPAFVPCQYVTTTGSQSTNTTMMSPRLANEGITEETVANPCE